MSARVWLEAVAGPIRGRRFSFEAHDTFLFGRAPDCHAALPAEDATASRHHFLLEVSPPRARLRDLGSLNGTWVNGSRHGGRRAEGTPKTAPPSPVPDVFLRHGDQIRVGATMFEFGVEGAAADGPAPTERVGLSPAAPRVPGYATGDLLGRGGMGAVYRARRTSDGREVALKVMRPETTVDREARAAFLREIEVTRHLSHPNIVALLEHGTVGEQFFFAMEYCGGGSLAALLRRRAEPLPPPAAVRVALLLLEGLAEAHARGFVHRDIKPENVLLGDESLALPKLADFGLAKSFEQAGLSGLTATGIVAGTPCLMPREQLTSFRLLRPASDVWSLGATLYHMVTGAYPRDFPRGADPLQVVLEGRIVPVRERVGALPAPLAAVVDRAVSDDLAVRYPDASALRAALREALPA